MDFSVIQQDPTIRALVQDNALIREMKDALYPRNLFRGEAAPVLQPGQAGDQFVFTGNGLMAPTTNPLNPRDEPEAIDYEKEQWNMQLHQYAGRCPDTSMPTSIVAIANLFTNNVHQLGLHAAQSLNRCVRDRLYNAGLSGQTVCTAVQASGTTITVARLNGLTTSRRPDLSAGSPVQFAAISATNPLKIHYKNAGVTHDATATQFTPTYSGDETGPGVLTVTETVTLAVRDPVWSDDCSFIVRPASTMLSVDGLAATSTFTFDMFRQAVARLEDSNVPKMPDGFYHSHFNSYSKNQLFSSDEAQKLLTSLPDYYWYKEFTLGDVLGTLVFNDTETPKKSNIAGGLQNAYNGNARMGERFGGEFTTGATISAIPSTEVQRPIFIGAEAIYEYYADLRGLITEAGINGEIGDFSQLTNNGVEVNADRVQCYLRAPVNVMGDLVTGVWKTIMDWPTRTDAATGDSARYKRCVVCEHV
jgi:hypothetical protein